MVFMWVYSCMRVRVILCVCVHAGWGLRPPFLSGHMQQLSLGMSAGSVRDLLQKKFRTELRTAVCSFQKGSHCSCLWLNLGPAQPQPWRISTSTTPMRRRLWRTATPRRSIWLTETPNKSMRTWWRFVQKWEKKNCHEKGYRDQTHSL